MAYMDNSKTATPQLPVKDVLSKKNTDALRGILAMVVLVHHLYEYAGFLEGTLVGLLLQVIGYLCVALFFFLSGYGLMFSVKSKGQDYIRSLPRKRILPLWCFYLFLIALYVAMNFIRVKLMGEPFRAGTPLFDPTTGAVQWWLLLKSFLFGFGKTVVGNGWYFQVILIFYLAFWLIFTVFHSERDRWIGMTAFTLAYIAVCVAAGIFWLGDQPNTVYEAVPCFLLGMLWSSVRPRLLKTFDRTYKVLLAGVAVFFLFVVFMILRLFLRSTGHERGVIDLGLKVGAAPLFCIGVICVLWVIPISCKPLHWLGSISLEIYAMQGIFFMLFDAPVIGSRPIRWIAVTVATIVAAWLVHLVRMKLRSVLRRKEGGPA